MAKNINFKNFSDQINEYLETLNSSTFLDYHFKVELRCNKNKSSDKFDHEVANFVYDTLMFRTIILIIKYLEYKRNFKWKVGFYSKIEKLILNDYICQLIKEPNEIGDHAYIRKIQEDLKEFLNILNTKSKFTNRKFQFDDKGLSHKGVIGKDKKKIHEETIVIKYKSESYQGIHIRVGIIFEKKPEAEKNLFVFSLNEIKKKTNA